MTQPVNPFRPLIHWMIPPPHAVRFVVHLDARLDVEMEPGREAEVAAYMHQQIDQWEHYAVWQARQAIEQMQAKAVAQAKIQEAVNDAAVKTESTDPQLTLKPISSET